jgi:hypothetical protein
MMMMNLTEVYGVNHLAMIWYIVTSGREYCCLDLCGRIDYRFFYRVSKIKVEGV